MLTLQLNQEQTNKGTNEIDARHAGHSLTQLQRNLQPLSANKRPVIASTPPVLIHSAQFSLLSLSLSCCCLYSPSFCLSCFLLVYQCVSTLELIKEPVIRPHSRKATTTSLTSPHTQQVEERVLTGLPSSLAYHQPALHCRVSILLVHTSYIFFFFLLSILHPSFVVGRTRPSAQPGCRMSVGGR